MNTRIISALIAPVAIPVIASIASAQTPAPQPSTPPTSVTSPAVSAPATKTFTYTGEMEMMPGMKTPVRSVVKVTDKNHRTFEWYENRGGQDMKTLEINYTRKK